MVRICRRTRVNSLGSCRCSFGLIWAHPPNPSPPSYTLSHLESHHSSSLISSRRVFGLPQPSDDTTSCWWRWRNGPIRRTVVLQSEWQSSRQETPTTTSLTDHSYILESHSVWASSSHSNTTLRLCDSVALYRIYLLTSSWALWQPPASCHLSASHWCLVRQEMW